MSQIGLYVPRGDRSSLRHSVVEPPWRRSVDLVADLVERENAAAAVFESRWTRQALRRVDPELDGLLDAQRELFSEALADGTDAYIQRQGEAMIRGWHAAIKRMADAKQPDDGYMFGCAPGSGVCVAIGPRAAAARVRELYGDIVLLTPDEVAELVAPLLQPIGQAKELWPGAQVTAVRSRSAPAPQESAAVQAKKEAPEDAS